MGLCISHVLSVYFTWLCLYVMCLCILCLYILHVVSVCNGSVYFTCFVCIFYMTLSVCSVSVYIVSVYFTLLCLHVMGLCISHDLSVYFTCFVCVFHMLYLCVVHVWLCIVHVCLCISHVVSVSAYDNLLTQSIFIYWLGVQINNVLVML